MKILITGTNGFVGRNLKEYFQSRYEGLFCPKRQELDLLDSQAVQAYLRQHRFDVVVHCAVTLYSVEQNLAMYLNLAQGAGAFGKMLCVGSGAEYDKDHYVPKMTEEYFGLHVPVDIYGLSKYKIAQDIENNPRNIFNLRVFGIYGKYEDYRRRFISNNICRVLSGLPLSINKNMYFDYLYVDDFAKIVEMFMARDPLQRSYNICTGQNVDLLTLAHIIQDIDGKNLPIVIREEGWNPEYSGDNTRFIKEFGVFHFTEHAKAIRALYDWYKNESQIVFDTKSFA